MSDYPRDLKDKDGNLREFKCKEDVPPGWFVRDTGEEVNPASGNPLAATLGPIDVSVPKKKGKHAPVEAPTEEPEAE